MDIGKQQIFEERRKERANKVKIQFVTPDCFNVVDDEGNLKYVGSLKPLDCTCQSFMQLNNKKYEDTHPETAKMGVYCTS